METTVGLSEIDKECVLCSGAGCMTDGLFFLCHNCVHALSDQDMIAFLMTVIRQDVDPGDCTLDTFGRFATIVSHLPSVFG